MLRLRPFAALRPQPELAHKVTSVPYDVVNTEEAPAMAAGNPLCFLHVSRAEIDLPANVDPYDDRVYAGAQQAFARLIEGKTLLREAGPALYAYRQQAELMGKR